MVTAVRKLSAAMLWQVREDETCRMCPKSRKDQRSSKALTTTKMSSILTTTDVTEEGGYRKEKARQRRSKRESEERGQKCFVDTLPSY
ncbi:hypothetical protein H920_14769 [Fukomys damarensis]|uniref:Uncharacterized protein n=1 Tax=Fukomys damarensis TaxID=885580 RepID=A0A091DM14_FUKDA|nr:hypothetical protein H920_14769 [Fukomys damarensis]